MLSSSRCWRKFTPIWYAQESVSRRKRLFSTWSYKTAVSTKLLLRSWNAYRCSSGVSCKVGFTSILIQRFIGSPIWLKSFWSVGRRYTHRIKNGSALCLLGTYRRPWWKLSPWLWQFHQGDACGRGSSSSFGITGTCGSSTRHQGSPERWGASTRRSARRQGKLVTSWIELRRGWDPSFAIMWSGCYEIRTTCVFN